MSEEQTNFKVTDRRLFNPDGSPRDVPPEDKASLETTLPVTPDTAAAAPATETTTSSNRNSALGPQPTQPSQSEEDFSDAGSELPGADDPASFASFLMSIASNAASSLGMMEHPVTGKRDVDLELGKHWIDVIAMLQKKTLGNLLPQEQQILDGLLADLRMQYVSLTSAQPKTARTYTSRDITGG
jgi:hypothetical protein